MGGKKKQTDAPDPNSIAAAINEYTERLQRLGAIDATPEPETVPDLPWGFWAEPAPPYEPCSCGAKHDRHFPNVHMSYCYFYKRGLK